MVTDSHPELRQRTTKEFVGGIVRLAEGWLVDSWHSTCSHFHSGFLIYGPVES
jgi:hypothetical protein